MQILCLGDIALSEKKIVNLTWSPPNGFVPGKDLKILFNWELPVGEKINPTPRVNDAPRILSFPESPKVLKHWAPGFAALATNHILDGGEQGLFYTISSLQQEGFITVGAGKTQEEITKSLVWETKEGKLGIINWVFPETHPDWLSIPGPHCWPGIEEAKKHIIAIRNKVDWVMVLAHWSDELIPYPRPEDRMIAQELVNAGIDIMVCHHPHVVRGMEYINHCPIFYSLGNYYFSNSIDSTGKRIAKWAPRNYESLGIQISFKKGKIPEFKILSFYQNNGQTSLDTKKRASHRLNETSKPLKKYKGLSYYNWYQIKRERFFKWEIRWHFGIKKLGFWESIRYVGRKIKSIYLEYL